MLMLANGCIAAEIEKLHQLARLLLVAIAYIRLADGDIFYENAHQVVVTSARMLFREDENQTARQANAVHKPFQAC